MFRNMYFTQKWYVTSTVGFHKSIYNDYVNDPTNQKHLPFKIELN